ncbi:hypothetical protein CEUSTIGMA_g10230.t1 [Chlamydomonas eustigma]|uniref:Flavin reductase like domain-containing protein n=1 Tax=Chlamydomonas eustigma TaxID=1157962 RepID=A0A250XI99_9CHLO|nr:hypothetical protein CEUSTIGMA_g10230.t1 [Chlamydomonas eustigma]|eukprot:GAX82804.1 hypothetical protein CEUSTIGMA_g10230.t1 [Chlamydomonas eustigma]
MICKTCYPSLRGSRYQVRRIVPATFHKLYPALWKFPNAVASNLKSQVYSVSVCGSTGHSFIEYDVSARGIHYDKAYSILSSLVVPRPIALVSTKGSDGSVNAAPYSFFNVMGIDPPLVVFGPSDQADGSPKDTLRNISESNDFVVNLVNEEILEAMNKCAVALSYGDSELSFAGLTAVPSTVVKSPRILEAPANLECKKFDILRVGKNN